MKLICIDSKYICINLQYYSIKYLVFFLLHSPLVLIIDGIHQEHVCGRPLGLHLDSQTKALYAADAYYGLFKVNTSTGLCCNIYDTLCKNNCKLMEEF